MKIFNKNYLRAEGLAQQAIVLAVQVWRPEFESQNPVKGEEEVDSKENCGTPKKASPLWKKLRNFSEALLGLTAQTFTSDVYQMYKWKEREHEEEALASPLKLQGLRVENEGLTSSLINFHSLLSSPLHCCHTLAASSKLSHLSHRAEATWSTRVPSLSVHLPLRHRRTWRRFTKSPLIDRRLAVRALKKKWEIGQTWGLWVFFFLIYHF